MTETETDTVAGTARGVTRGRVARALVLMLALGAVTSLVVWTQTRERGRELARPPAMAATPPGAGASASAGTSASASAGTSTSASSSSSTSSGSRGVTNAPEAVAPKPVHVDREVYFSTSKAMMAPALDPLDGADRPDGVGAVPIGEPGDAH